MLVPPVFLGILLLWRKVLVCYIHHRSIVVLFIIDNSLHPPSQRRWISLPHLLLIFLMCIMLLGDVLGGWTGLLPVAFAAGRPSDPPATTTFQHFLTQGHASHGAFVYPKTFATVPRTAKELAALTAQPPSSVEPATMQPLQQVLDATLTTVSTTAGTTLGIERGATSEHA